MSLYVTFNGRLGNDAEIKTSAKGNQFVTFTVAVDDYDSATKQRITNWVRVTDFSSRATNMIQYLRKGTSVFVTGSLTCGVYLDKTNNVPKISYDATAFRIEFCGSANQNSNTVQAQPNPSVAQPNYSVYPNPNQAVGQQPNQVANYAQTPSYTNQPYGNQPSQVAEGYPSVSGGTQNNYGAVPTQPLTQPMAAPQAAVQTPQTQQSYNPYPTPNYSAVTQSNNDSDLPF
jgi:single-strand DNA-binding protein